MFQLQLNFNVKVENLFLWVNEDRDLLVLMPLLISYATGSHIRTKTQATDFSYKKLNNKYLQFLT